MPIGRNCVAHYRELSRYCVFSHDEMVCNMASKADTMDVDMAAILQKEIIVMVEEEEKLREMVKKMVISFIWCIFSFMYSLYHPSSVMQDCVSHMSQSKTVQV